MVQINLPKNSEVQKGNYYQDKTGSKNIRKVNVYRWDPSNGENPRVDTYEVDMDNCPSKVLDILNKIKNEIIFLFVGSPRSNRGSIICKTYLVSRNQLYFS